MLVETVPLDRIEIRERTRKAISNIDSLAASIEARGLLQPIVLRRDNGALVLVAGGRRIEALKQLGRIEVPANIVQTLDDELDALLAEGEENTEREQFTPSESVAHAGRIEAVEIARAAERRRDGARKAGQAVATAPVAADVSLFPEFSTAEAVVPQQGVPNLGTPSDPFADTKAKPDRSADHVAKAVGMKRSTLAKAKHIVDTAENPDVPDFVRETAQEAKREMDRTGHVDGYHRRVKVAEEVAEQQAKVESGAKVDDYLGDGQALEDASYRHEFLRQVAKAATFLAFDPARIADIGDEKCMTALAGVRKQIDEFHDKVQNHRPRGLRVINGG